MRISTLPEIAWRVSDAPVDYLEAVAEMERLVAAIHAGDAPETVWLLEHPPLYTAGTSARASDVLAPGGLPVFPTGRGGQVTWHGPGQRIAYVMLDLRRRGGDVRGFVRALEAWLIATLGRFNVRGERREGRVGIWVDRGPATGVAGAAPGTAPASAPGAPTGARREDKIAAIGVRVRRWVTFHGVSLNVDCELAAYRGIVPCGVSGPQFGVTSLLDLGIIAPMPDVDAALMAAFGEAFPG